MTNKNKLCEMIRTIYPDVGACGIDVEADYDQEQQRWTVTLRKDEKELKTYLEPGDVEHCLMGEQCLSLSIEINQLKDSIERMPDGISYPPKSKIKATKKAVCVKAPEFAEHYRLEDSDEPCDDGRSWKP